MITPAPGQFKNVVDAVKRAASLKHAVAQAAHGAAVALGGPIAILSHGAEGWRFEAEGVAEGSVECAAIDVSHSTVARPTSDNAPGWTGVLLGRVADRDWMLMVPGEMGDWSEVPGLDEFASELRDHLELAAARDDAAFARRLQRRLYRSARRLTSGRTDAGDHILRDICAQTRARIGALAQWIPAEGALAITGTMGYPSASVEHLRVRPYEGILGEVLASRRPLLVTRHAPQGLRRLRYATDSFMVLPVLAGNRCTAIIAVTDRVDGGPFDTRDFESARLLAAQAAAYLGDIRSRNDVRARWLS